MSIITAFETLREFKRRRREEEQHKRLVSSLYDHAAAAEKMQHAEAEQRLGHGRIADIDDAYAYDLVNDDGLYIGKLDGVTLRYNAESTLITLSLIHI